ncbi:MAG TPA: hypothetical protein PLC54_09055 [Spirochaetales bacterium]|nr:hypothetical protein [Spirochaetales bacterium]
MDAVQKKAAGGPWFRVGLAFGIVLLVCGAALGAVLASRQKPAAVERSLSLYIESLAPSGKLVVAEAKDRLDITETTPGFLFGDSGLGRLLGIRSDASISASAWANLSFCIDLYAAESWSVRYVPEHGGRIEFAAPPLGMLTPAILTDTIELRVKDRSIFLNEQRLSDQLLRSLTARFVEAASAMLERPDVRQAAAEGLRSIARAYAQQAGIAVSEIGVNFAPPED